MLLDEDTLCFCFYSFGNDIYANIVAHANNGLYYHGIVGLYPDITDE